MFSGPQWRGKARNLRQEVYLFPVYGLLLPLVEEPLNRAHIYCPHYSTTSIHMPAGVLTWALVPYSWAQLRPFIIE